MGKFAEIWVGIGAIITIVMTITGMSIFYHANQPLFWVGVVYYGATAAVMLFAYLYGKYGIH
jgi:hypothetical protein